MLVIIVALVAFVLGIVMPLRWGVFGYFGFSLLFFVVMAAVKTSIGFGGPSINDSLALFNNSWASYIGFNIRVTYRAFALVILALSVPFIFRLSRATRPRGGTA